MEAFILMDKVIAKEHMSKHNNRPKYLKRYDLPLPSDKRKADTHIHRKPLTPLAFANAPRTKDLLTDISNIIETAPQSPLHRNMDKFFSIGGQPLL